MFCGCIYYKIIFPILSQFLIETYWYLLFSILEQLAMRRLLASVSLCLSVISVSLQPTLSLQRKLRPISLPPSVLLIL